MDVPAVPISLRLPALLLALLPLDALAADQWIVATDLWGNHNYQTLHLDVQDGRIEGRLDADPVTGTMKGDQVAFVATDSQGQRYQFNGRLQGMHMQGQSEQPDTNNREARAVHAFSAWKVPARTTAAPQRHVFMRCSPVPPRPPVRN